MRELVTTTLDTLGLLLVAAGAAAPLYPVIGWACLAVSGAVVLSGTWWSARQGQRTGGAS